MLNSFYYKTLNKNTQKAKNYILRYRCSTNYTIYDVYVNPSIHKRQAENSCIHTMNAVNGYGYKILGANCMKFSCGYIVQENKKQYLIVETAENRYLIEYER